MCRLDRVDRLATVSLSQTRVGLPLAFRDVSHLQWLALSPCYTGPSSDETSDDSADDVKNVDLTKVHYLSGPFEIESAEPGDVPPR